MKLLLIGAVVVVAGSVVAWLLVIAAAVLGAGRGSRAEASHPTGPWLRIGSSVVHLACRNQRRDFGRVDCDRCRPLLIGDPLPQRMPTAAPIPADEVEQRAGQLTPEQVGEIVRDGGDDDAA